MTHWPFPYCRAVCNELTSRADRIVISCREDLRETLLWLRPAPPADPEDRKHKIWPEWLIFTWSRLEEEEEEKS